MGCWTTDRMCVGILAAAKSTNAAGAIHIAACRPQSGGE